MAKASPEKVNLYVELQGAPGVGKSEQVGYLMQAIGFSGLLKSDHPLGRTLKRTSFELSWLKDPTQTVTIDADGTRDAGRAFANQFAAGIIQKRAPELFQSSTAVPEGVAPEDIRVFMKQAELLKEGLKAQIVRKLFYEEKNVIAEGSFFLPGVDYAPIDEEHGHLAYEETWKRAKKKSGPRGLVVVKVPILLTQTEAQIEKRLKKRKRKTAKNTKAEIKRILTISEHLEMLASANDVDTVKSTNLPDTSEKLMEIVDKQYKRQILGITK